MAKRPDGTLEHAVMVVLWSHDAPATPTEVRRGLDMPLAYTTVATVLGRLAAKGHAERIETDGAIRYRAAVDEAELSVRRVRQILDGVADARPVFERLVGALTPGELDALRAAVRPSGD